MNKEQALKLVNAYRIPLNQNFHTLSSEVVERILDAANTAKYRAPSGRNGSRGRYFYAYLTRLCVPRSYVTTYCNKPHYVATGKPIGHECYKLPPEALRLEISGDYEGAIAILEKAKLSPR